MPAYHTGKGQSTVAKDNIFEDDRFLDLKETLKDGLLSFCTAAGLTALHVVMEENVTELVGPRGKHDPRRDAYRHGTEATSVILAGVNTSIKRPRVRTIDGQELQIEAYELAKNQDLLCQVALGRMLHGLSSRNFNYGAEIPGSKGPTKSTVSRRFIQATEAEFKKLIGRPIPDIVVLFVDGVQPAFPEFYTYDP